MSLFCFFTLGGERGFFDRIFVFCLTLFIRPSKLDQESKLTNASMRLFYLLRQQIQNKAQEFHSVIINVMRKLLEKKKLKNFEESIVLDPIQTLGSVYRITDPDPNPAPFASANKK